MMRRTHVLLLSSILAACAGPNGGGGSPLEPPGEDPGDALVDPEPPGLDVLIDVPFNPDPGAVPPWLPAGWDTDSRTNPNVFSSSDSGAPVSPSGVLAMRFPLGMHGGVAPGILGKPLGRGYDTVFVSTAWKASDGFESHPSLVNKLIFIFSGNTAFSIHFFAANQITLQAAGTSVPEGAVQIRPNTGGSPDIRSGRWYRLELLLEHLAADEWRARLWIDGRLYLDSARGYTTSGGQQLTRLPFATSGIDLIQISPTWGGIEFDKLQEDFFWFDHLYVSGR